MRGEDSETRDLPPCLPHQAEYRPPPPALPRLSPSARRYLRSPGLAVLLSVIVAGLGHMYIGQMVRGVILMGAWFALGLLQSALLGGQPSVVWLFRLPKDLEWAQLILCAAAAVDAYRGAVWVNQQGRL